MCLTSVATPVAAHCAVCCGPGKAMEDTRASQLSAPAIGATQESSGPTAPGVPDVGSAIGRYLVLEVLGHGAMGIVYAAFDPELDRKVALKLLRRSDGRGGTMGRKRLVREAQSMAKLAHPNVVAVHDVGEWEGKVFVAMEFIDGLTLKQWAAAEPRRWREILEVYGQAAAGLDAAHAAGIVHRDFKPDNCMIGSDGRVRVLDFGLASATEGIEPGSEPDASLSAELSLTRTGAVMGTPAYMSPEQHRGAATTARTDQFSLSVAIFEAMYGHRPFGGTNLPTLAFNVLRGKLREPEDKKRAPSWIHQVLVRGLATEPEDRWPSVAALMDELERPIRQRQARRKALVLVGVAAALAGVLVGSKALETRRQHRLATARENAAQQRLESLVPELSTMVEADLAKRAFSSVESFAALDDVRETRAVPRAWMALSAALARHGEHELELQSSANAFAAAADDAAQQEVLLGLVEPFHEGRRWGSLAAVLGDLEPRSLGRPEVVQARVATAFVHGDFSSAALQGERSPGWAGAVAPLARALSQARPIDIAGWDAIDVVDLDGDGRVEVLVASPQHVDIRRGAGEMEVLRTVSLHRDRDGNSDGSGSIREVFGLAGADAIVVRRSGPAAGRPKYGFYSGATAVPGPERLTNLTEIESVDLDGDGVVEHYGSVSYPDRRLVRLEPDSEAWTAATPDPDTDAVGSDINGLASGDFDGDGSVELAVAVGPWSGYMVRLLRPAAAGGLETTASLEMGVVRDAYRLRDGERDRLMVRKVNTLGNVPFFGKEHPHGPYSPGLYEIGVESGSGSSGDVLSVIGEHHPDASFGLGRGIAADIDGDGRDELYCTGQSGTGILTLDGTWVETRAFRVLGAGNFDEDDADELLVHQGESVYVLGAGSQVLPPVDHGVPPVAPAPDSVAGESETVARLWARGERLVSMGLGAQSIAVFEGLASVSETSPARIDAVLRAAALAQRERSAEEAFAIYDGALKREFAWELALPAARLAEQMHAFEDAKKLWSRAPASAADQAEEATRRLDLYTAQKQSLVNAEGEVHPGVQYVRPDAARIAAGRGLLLSAPAGVGELLRADLDVEGSFVSLELEGQWTRSEWGAGIVVELVGEEGTVLSAKAHAYGGAAGIKRVLKPIGDRSTSWVAKSEDAEPISLLLEAVDDRRLYDLEGGGTRNVTRMADEPSLKPGRYTLVIRSVEKPDPSPVLAQFVIESLSLGGAQVGEYEPDAMEQQVRRMVRGEPELDLAVLTQAEQTDRRVFAALALERAGRRVEAVAHLVGLDLDVEGDPWFELSVALRGDGGRNAPMLRELLGDRYWSLWFFAWRSVAYQHPRSRALEIALSGLGDLEQAATADPASAAIAAWWRGSGHGRRGEVERARADLQQSVALAEAVLETEPTQDLRNAHAAACRALATLDRGRGAEADALAWEERSVTFSLTPEMDRRRLQRR